jgi:hypothetical protein
MTYRAGGPPQLMKVMIRASIENMICAIARREITSGVAHRPCRVCFGCEIVMTDGLVEAVQVPVREQLAKVDLQIRGGP